MAINPLIPLQANANLSQGINALTQGVQQRPIQQAKKAEAKTAKDAAARELALNQFKSVYTGASQVAPFLQQGDTESAKRVLTRRLSALREAGVNTDHTEEALSTLEQDPSGKTLLSQVTNTIQAGDKLFGGATSLPAAIQDRRDLIGQLPVDEQGRLKPIDQMTAAEKAIAVEAGLVPRAVGTGAITAATTEGLTDRVSKSEGTIEAGKAAGKQAIEQSGKAFEQLASVRQNISVLDEGIQAIDEGADTGPIMSRLPSVRESSIKLDNVRGRLGLDVIGGTTFGALSEAELKFALDTAIPRNLGPQELRDWMQRKKEAQQKLAQELESAAIYLGTPGNTPAGYLEMRRNQLRGQQGASQQGQQGQQGAQQQGGGFKVLRIRDQ